MSQDSMKPFDTVQYCIDNNVPCFTFIMNYTKIAYKLEWNTLNSSNFHSHVNKAENGFAIIMGYTHVMIDIDVKHSMPEEMIKTLKQGCRSYERTPGGGYHFYFVADERTNKLINGAGKYWNGVKYPGLDLLMFGGIAYCAPCSYLGVDGTKKEYKWEHGDLSKAEGLSDEIWEALQHPNNMRHEGIQETSVTDPTELQSEEEWSNIVSLVAMFSVERATSYSSWRDVIFALRNTEKSKRMLELCHTFSARSSKYDAGSVNKKFYGKLSRGTRLSASSLWYWAKLDSFDKYIEFRSKRKDVNAAIINGSQANIAELFYDLNQERYLYSSEEGWYELQSNNVWKSMSSHDIKTIPSIMNGIRNDCMAIAIKVMQNNINNEENINYKQACQTAKMLGNSSFIKGASDFLKGYYHKDGIEKRFNANRDIFAFTNGVWDTTTHTFRKTEPDDYITVTTGYPYRPPTDAEMRKVSSLLMKIFPFIVLYDYMLKALSLGLTGYNSAEMFHILTGTGANGKSLLMDLCKKVMGEYYKTLSVSYLTQDDKGRDKPLPELVAIRYARMVVSSEPEARDRFQINFIKMISGNDDIECRALYGKQVSYKPQFKLWIPSNDIPKFSKYDRGIERRTRCINFPTRFVHEPRHEHEEKRDETLKQKLDADESWTYGMLGLLLNALKSMGNRLLMMPEEVQAFTDQYLLDNNPVGSWLKRFYERTERREDIIQKSALYNQYLQDGGQAMSQKSFSEDMIKSDIQEKKVDGNRYYYGLIRKEIPLEE